MELELSAEERELLERIVERALGEMRVEVRRTTTPKYHDDLAEEQARLKGLLARIRELAGSG
jgi:hypothetical protein